MDDKLRNKKTPHGLLFAALIMLGWSASLGTGLFLLQPLSQYPLSTLLLVLLTTFFFTGLFITAHDGMHRTIAPGHRTVNDLLGAAAVRLYALFSFRRLCKFHELHHKNPGSDRDPDFSESHPHSFLRWYSEFLFRYITAGQLLGMAVIANVLIHLLEVPTLNVLVCWALPAVLSTLQLFYFGTYLPHRPDERAFCDSHNARSLLQNRLASFFSCYHFGCHHQHHLTPGVPWWALWSTEQSFLTKN